MEQKAVLDNPPVSTLPFWKVLTGTMVIASGLIFGSAAALEKYDRYKASKAMPVYNQHSEQVTKSSYEVMTAQLTSDITGEAVIDLDNFRVPVKFVFNSSVKQIGDLTDTEITIENLEIGVITDIATGKNKFSDFTNWRDHKAINTALIAYIKKHHLLEGV